MGLGALHPRRLLLTAVDLTGRAIPVELLARLLPIELLARLIPGELADRVAGLLRSVPAERLDALMASPARRPILDAVFAQMPRHLNRRRARAVKATIRWRITRRGGEPDVYDLLIDDGHARIERGGAGDPGRRLEITVDGAEFLRIAAGGSNPMNAYFAGKLSLRGDVMQAARLTMLFRVPAPRRPDGGPSSGRVPRSAP